MFVSLCGSQRAMQLAQKSMVDAVNESGEMADIRFELAGDFHD